MPNFISEGQIEKAIINLLTTKFSWRHMDCFTAEPENLNDGSNRANKSEVVLLDILKERVQKLNPRLPESVIEEGISKLTARRYAMSPVLANREAYDFIRDGVPLEYENSKGKKQQTRVKIIDFNN